jgi:hypothetical protein
MGSTMGLLGAIQGPPATWGVAVAGARAGAAGNKRPTPGQSTARRPLSTIVLEASVHSLF